MARIENVVIKDAVSRLETDIARVDRRLTDTKAELRSDIARVEEGLRSDIAGVDGRIVATKEDFQQVNQTLLAAMSDNRKAFYVLCGTVIAGMVVALLKDGLSVETFFL